jgi:hypothetical protein
MLIKLCLSDMYSKAHVGNNLSDAFSVQNGVEEGDAMLYPHCFSTLL